MSDIKVTRVRIAVAVATLCLSCEPVIAQTGATDGTKVADSVRTATRGMSKPSYGSALGVELPSVTFTSTKDTKQGTAQANVKDGGFAFQVGASAPLSGTDSISQPLSLDGLGNSAVVTGSVLYSSVIRLTPREVGDSIKKLWDSINKLSDSFRALEANRKLDSITKGSANPDEVKKYDSLKGKTYLQIDSMDRTLKTANDTLARTFLNDLTDFSLGNLTALAKNDAVAKKYLDLLHDLSPEPIPWAITIKAKTAQRSLSYFGNSFAKHDTNFYDYGLQAGIGIFIPCIGSSLWASYEHSKIMNATASSTFLQPLGTGFLQKVGALGNYGALAQTNRYLLEGRTYLGGPFEYKVGLDPQFGILFQTSGALKKITSFELPVYYLQAKGGGLNGGIDFAWRSDQSGPQVTLFIGIVMDVLPD
jgi:hypothetical protein